VLENKVLKNEIGPERGGCGTDEVGERFIQGVGRNTWEKISLEELGLEGRILLK
jgi:hypothetical protein